MRPKRPRYAQHLMADRVPAASAICRELGDTLASTQCHDLHGDGTLKIPGVRLLGAAPTGGPQRDGMAAQGA